MQTKEKLTEIIKSTVVNAHGTKLGDVFHPEFVENIVNNLIEGGAIVPPCKVGDKIYWYNMGGEIVEAEARKIMYAAKHPHGFVYDIGFEDFGKTVFLTREEAEAALKEKESNGRK